MESMKQAQYSAYLGSLVCVPFLKHMMCWFDAAKAMIGFLAYLLCTKHDTSSAPNDASQTNRPPIILADEDAVAAAARMR